MLGLGLKEREEEEIGLGIKQLLDFNPQVGLETGLPGRDRSGLGSSFGPHDFEGKGQPRRVKDVLSRKFGSHDLEGQGSKIGFEDISRVSEVNKREFSTVSKVNKQGFSIGKAEVTCGAKIE